MAAIARTLSQDEVMRVLGKEIEGNNVCVDCGRPRPEWASINLGILMCLECSGVHRSLGTHITQVRSLKLDTNCWTEEVVAFMTSVGNKKFNKEWEKYLTKEYIKPSEFPKIRIVREHFIKEKYRERRFLAEPMDRARPNSGWLLKLGGGFRQKWQKRWFVIYERSKKISYFQSQNDSFPKNTLQLSSTSKIAILRNSEYKKPHCFSLTPGGASGSRSYVCQCESGADLMRWVQHLRYVTKCLKDSAAEDGEGEGNAMPPSPASAAIAAKLPRASQLCREEVIAHQGFLSKRGGKWHSWNKRWMVLTKKASLFYFKKQHDGAAVGMLNVKGSTASATEKGQSGYKPHGFVIKTEDRNFFLTALNDSERDMWIENVRQVA